MQCRAWRADKRPGAMERSVLKKKNLSGELTECGSLKNDHGESTNRVISARAATVSSALSSLSRILHGARAFRAYNPHSAEEAECAPPRA